MSNKNNTSISLNEHLSALLDDEAGAFEQTRVLDELTKNEVLRQSLSSYSLIGESMRSASTSDATTVTGNDFLAGIHEQIDKDSDYHQVHIEDAKKPAANSSSWLRPVGGFALAASFAAIAVIGVQNFQQTNTTSTEVLASAETKRLETGKTQLSLAAMNSATVVSAADMLKAEDKIVAVVADKSTGKVKKDSYKHADARTRELLKRYVDSHMQFASNTTFVPSVRVISYSDF
jgi:negative regulator of sigma E activity